MADYTYTLPPGRIAQQPLPQRDQARLLVSQKGRLSSHTFTELPRLLPPGALLLFNTTRVVPARLVFRRATGARIELFCLGPHPESQPLETALQARGSVSWHCLLGNAKRWKTAEPLTLQHPQLTLTAQRGAPLPEGDAIQFNWQPAHLTFAQVLEAAGSVPLPPYMLRQPTDEDTHRYQTVYADAQGAVAAPTAGLHFTQQLLDTLDADGFSRAEVILHVGAGTFKPVGSETLGGHPMHGEEFFVSADSLALLANTLQQGRPIIPVGTTSLRTLESLYWLALTGTLNAPLGQWAPYLFPSKSLPPASEVFHWLAAAFPQGLRGHTELLIAPGYPQWVASGLITNFHQPGSTLLLLVAALLGSHWQEVYAYALANGYRFLSYGDSSLLIP